MDLRPWRTPCFDCPWSSVKTNSRSRAPDKNGNNCFLAKRSLPDTQFSSKGKNTHTNPSTQSPNSPRLIVSSDCPARSDLSTGQHLLTCQSPDLHHSPQTLLRERQLLRLTSTVFTLVVPG